MKNKNIMQTVKINKLTLNVGAGKEQPLLEKGIKLIEQLAGKAPVKTKTSKRIPSWGLRPGLPIGCKLTLRGDRAKNMLIRFLHAKGNKLSESNFDNSGNLSFGVAEYIDIKDSKYDPEIGVIGLECALTLVKPGYRVKLRHLYPAKVGRNQLVSKDEAIKFMQENFKVEIEK